MHIFFIFCIVQTLPQISMCKANCMKVGQWVFGKKNNLKRYLLKKTEINSNHYSLYIQFEFGWLI